LKAFIYAAGIILFIAGFAALVVFTSPLTGIGLHYEEIPTVASFKVEVGRFKEGELDKSFREFATDWKLKINWTPIELRKANVSIVVIGNNKQTMIAAHATEDRNYIAVMVTSLEPVGSWQPLVADLKIRLRMNAN
jgi:hypothetical protein